MNRRNFVRRIAGFLGIAALGMTCSKSSPIWVSWKGEYTWRFLKRDGSAFNVTFNKGQSPREQQEYPDIKKLVNDGALLMRIDFTPFT